MFRSISSGGITLIKFDHVTKLYRPGVGLDDVNVNIDKGEFVFLVGPSGAGKSTFIKLMLKDLDPDTGDIIVGDYHVNKLSNRMVPKYRRKIGTVFQDFKLLPKKTAYENVAFAQRVAQKSEAEIRRNVPSMLSLVGLAGKYKAKPKQLAGGEQQRVALARALVNQPKLLLADEPTGNLDLYNTAEIMKLLETINENGTTVVVVTHNDKLVNDMKKRVVTIKQGMIVSDAENGGYFDEED